MKTDDLVSMLATGVGAVDAKAPARRYIFAIGGGALIAALMVIGLFHVRPTLAHDAALPMFWIKAAFCAALVAGGLLAVVRLSRPGTPLAAVPAGLAAPVLAMWMLAAAALLAADPQERMEMIFGQTWTACPFIIALLSAPVFVAMMWAMNGLAPTRLRLAGAAAGFTSGAIAALVYTLHCPELAAPFLAIWYLAGVLIPTVIGAWLGPRLLRW